MENDRLLRITRQEHAYLPKTKLYQARWEVELLYRELKRVYGLDEITSSKPEVVEALILIGLLSLVVSRTLRELFIEIIEEQQGDDGDKVEPSSLMPRERWGNAFSRRSDRILRRIPVPIGTQSGATGSIG